MMMLRTQNSSLPFSGLSRSASTFSNSQIALDAGVESFTREALNPSSLLGMIGSGIAFRAGRIFCLSLGSSLAPSPLRTSVWHLASNLIAFSGEVVAFEGITRSSRILLEGADISLLRWDGEQGFRKGLLNGVLSLGSLKFSGHLFQNPNLMVQHFVQDSAMVFSYEVAEHAHLEQVSHQTISQRYLHAEATLLQMNFGMSLVHGALPSLSMIERNLDSSSSFQVVPRFGIFENIHPLTMSSESHEGGQEVGIIQIRRVAREMVQYSRDAALQSQALALQRLPETDSTLAEHPFVTAFEMQGWVILEDVNIAPYSVRISLRPKEGIFPSEAVSVAKSDWEGLSLRKQNGEVIKVDYNIEEPDIFQSGDTLYLQRLRYHEKGISFSSFVKAYPKYRRAIFRSEVSYWRATRDPLALTNFDTLGSSERNGYKLWASVDRELVKEVHDSFAEMCSGNELLEILFNPESPEALREAILKNPPRVPEAADRIQDYLRESERGFFQERYSRPQEAAFAGLYQLTHPGSAGEEGPLRPKGYWEIIAKTAKLPICHLFPDIMPGDFPGRLDLYEQHLFEAGEVVANEGLHAEVRTNALAAFLGTVWAAFRNGNENAELKSVRERQLARILRVEEKSPEIVWDQLLDKVITTSLIDQGFVRREQVLGRMTRAFEKWEAETPTKYGDRIDYRHRGTVELWLKLAEGALEVGENPFGDWLPSADASGVDLVALGESSTTPLGKFFKAFFKRYPKEHNDFARLIARYGEVKASHVEEAIEAARAVHEVGVTCDGHAYITVLGAVRDARAVAVLLEELDSVSAFFGMNLSGKERPRALFAAEKTSLDYAQEYHNKTRLEAVLIALHAQRAILPPEIIRKILIGMAKYNGGIVSAWTVKARTLLFPLYDLDPVATLTTYYEIEGSPLPLHGSGEKLSHRIEGLLASLSWFVQCEGESIATKRKRAMTHWREFFGEKSIDWNHRHVKWELEKWGNSSENLIHYLESVNAADIVAWRAYFEQYPEKIDELRSYAFSKPLGKVQRLFNWGAALSQRKEVPLPPTQRLARRMLELLAIQP